MSTRKRVKSQRRLSNQPWQLAVTVYKGLARWLLIRLRQTRQQTRRSPSGFVLPTVTMVSLVVVMLTTAMMLRSFDRSRAASNIRVNQAVLNAATPALDRARVKIDAMFADPTLARVTPTDIDLHQAITNSLERYTLGDEQPLKLVYDLGNGRGGNSNNTIESLAAGSTTSLEQDETLTTAWRFPVDTDNNGKYDSYTLYGIYFRSPTQDQAGQTNRPRNPLEARTPPMESAIAGDCAAALGSSASPVGTSGWYKSGSQFQKSFYVYTATVPIITPANSTDYEAYQGNRSFSALEYHQDRARIPLSNHAAAYENDLEISPDAEFRLNGRIFTNGNLLAGNDDNQEIELYQVSSKDSCHYQAENSKIVVGGNVANGGVTADQELAEVNVHLFNGTERDIRTATISNTNKSTSNPPREVGYNAQAYAERLALLVEAQMDNSRNTDPRIVRQAVEAEENLPIPANESGELRQARLDQVRREQLETYFRKRLRRVPFSEVPYGSSGQENQTKSSVLLTDNNNPETLRPPAEWSYPTDPDNGQTSSTYTGLNLLPTQLQAAAPESPQGTEVYLGDRIQVGNNLPPLWFEDGAFVDAKVEQEILGATWQDSSQLRYRTTQVQQLTDSDVTDRDGFWEEAAAAQPSTAVDNSGGLRVITGAGVYERKNSFLPPPTYDDPTTVAVETLPTYDDPTTNQVEEYPLVWSDAMPMSPGGQVYDNAAETPGWKPLDQPSATTPTIDPNTPQFAKGDLRLRATAVYHYTQDAYDPNNPTDYQTPIACVSNYYDPTDNITARNLGNLPDVSGDLTEPRPDGAKSNNGVVYSKPTVDATSLTGISTFSDTTGLFRGDEAAESLPEKLGHQANLRFPDGRFVNQPLRQALQRKAINQDLTLAEQAAIDSTICALQILDGSINPDPRLIPHGAIREIAFLDGRQVKAIEADTPDTNPLETFTTDGNPLRAQGEAILTGNYNLSLEERQPLEIRATVLDLNALRQQRIDGGLASEEYLLPNSGIIYASRDDALPDLSDKSLNTNNNFPDITMRRLMSPVDFKLDPTRRPHGILLTAGSELWRSPDYREAEKGLILASNLPVYIQGDFNLHNGEEFKNNLAPDWNNFYSRRREQLNYDFACRPGDPRLPNCNIGDPWRPATVLADAITLLSNDFQFGFRHHGDYDLRNNQGDRDSIRKRKRNGFWNNNFVTNGLSSGGITIGNNDDITPTDADYTTGNSTNAVDSSYFNNFITPIQRRGNFPEYLMEVCPKLPVSECRASDWYVNPDPQAQKRITDGQAVIGQQFNIKDFPAGTTAIPAAPQYQRYARRVAFNRSPDGYRLDVTGQFPDGSIPTGQASSSDKATVKPIGIDQNGKVKIFSYPNNNNDARTENVGLPRTVDNALWFRTTNNTDSDPGLEADITYESNKPLYYLPPEQGGNKLILPEVPDIQGVPISLNSPEGNQSASDYSVCVGDSSSQSYLSTANSLTQTTQDNQQCPAATLTTIREFYQRIQELPESSFTKITDSNFDNNNNKENKEIQIDAQQNNQNLNLYELNITDFIPNDKKIILDSQGNQDAIFVLKAESLQFGNPECVRRQCPRIEVETRGFSPNNVFWVVENELRVTNASDEKSPHELLGNFVGTGDIFIGNHTKITGRVLGFAGIEISDDGAAITATASDEQPLLVPVLQFHSPDGTPGSNPDSGRTQVRDTRWLMSAGETTYNLVAVAGDTPNRVNSTIAESNGGLPNFIRFLENWRDETIARINGSFIQFKRSVYATAPFTTVLSSDRGGLFDYQQAYATSNGSLTNNSNWGSLPYFVPPNRQWQFDVALLSQLTDLFSQRFTLPAANPPKESFRQASRDDEWIQTLLCAAVNENPQVDSNYEKYAVDDEQRPNCPRSLSDY